MSQTTNDQNDTGWAWARRPDEGTGPIRQPEQGPAAPVEPVPGDTVQNGQAGQLVASPPASAPTSSGHPTASYATPGNADPVSPERPDQGADYAAPSYPTASYPTPSHPGPSYPGPSYPGPSYPSNPGPAYGPAYGAEPVQGSGDGGPPPGLPPASRREPRRPGWGGVFAVGAGSAVLASLLTAGIVLQTQDDSATTPASSTSTSAQVKAPVTGSSTSTPDWGKVAAAVEPSVVAVQVTGPNGSGEGSGVIYDKSGRIVTNNHVAAGGGTGSTIKVVLNDGRGYAATVVGTDPSTDLAVLKITNPPSDLTPAVLGSSSSVEVGDAVMAVGNPLGLAGTVTTGIVSATNRPVTTEAESADPNATSSGETVVTNAIQTDAAVNPGNSGGALVDAQGRVIGVPSSIASLGSSSSFGQTTQSGSIGLGFAIPIDEVKDVASQLIKGGSVAHSWLGVSPADGSTTVDGASRDAAVLKSIVDGSPAQKAGLKAGDVVTAVDGQTVNSATSLVGSLRERTPGTTVTLTVVRDGKASDLRVTLGTRPSSAN